MYFFLTFLSRLPLPILQFLAFCIASILVLFPQQGMRWIIRVNLHLAYPHLTTAERDQFERKNTFSQCLTTVESIKCWGMSPEYSIKQIKNITGLDVLLDALKNPNGVIAVVPHFGTWEIMNAWLNLYTAPVIMYKPSKNVGVDRFMLEARQRLNATLVPTDETGVRAIFKSLKRGGFTAILPDQVPDHSGGIYSRFFGHEVLTSTLVSKLAQKTKCSVIGLSCIRHPDRSGFDIVCEYLSEGICDPDLQVSVDTLNSDIEHMISRAPEQYVWAYKRFKRMKNQSLKDIYKPEVFSLRNT